MGKSRQAAAYWPACAVAFFSILYFVDVCVRASEKYFWYDELLTVYFSRLPNIQTIWNALQTGVDSNSPLFFLITRASEAIFGEGPIGTRVPEFIGFWVFCVCIFVFVNRRAGPLAGFIAMLFPTVTGAFYYAYEARPHALVLGCCGALLVCWQHGISTLQRSPHQRRWLIAFSFFLFCGLMLHAYALMLTIPFALAEATREFRSKKIDWLFWIALITPVLPTLFLYLRLRRYLVNIMQGTPFLAWFPANWLQVTYFYDWLLLPCLLIILFTLVVLLLNFLETWASDRQLRISAPVHWDDVALSLGFLLLPAFGVLTAKIIHAPFFSRYFLSAIAGICILVGMSATVKGAFNISAVLILAVLALSFTFSCSKLLWHRHNHWGEQLFEPSTGTPFESSLSSPIAMHSLLLDKRWSSQPIALLDPLEYVYFSYYAPQLARRIYCPLPSPDDISYRLIRRLRECCHTSFNLEVTDEEFVRMNRHFVAYGSSVYLYRLAAIQGKGIQVGPLQVANGHFLAEIIR